MSTESRLKKLRGSGGYIMATITEEQQRKGNLGGPDLFLAPIGRIDSSKISKHYCNSCEKDYDGGPQIKYETPNEEVAENLILVEKGKYLCNVCGSTIAEYREFRKPDQASEVGNAKPIAENISQNHHLFKQPHLLKPKLFHLVLKQKPFSLKAELYNHSQIPKQIPQKGPILARSLAWMYMMII